MSLKNTQQTVPMKVYDDVSARRLPVKMSSRTRRVAQKRQTGMKGAGAIVCKE